MAKLTKAISAANLDVVLTVADFIRTMLGKKPKLKAAKEALGDDAKLYLEYSARVDQAALDGVGYMMTPAEVQMESKANNYMVKLATKLLKAMK